MTNWHLLSNEKKIHEVAVSRKLFLSNYLIAGLFFAAAAGIDYIDYPFPKLYASAALIVGGIILLFAIERKRTSEVMLITNQRILIMRQPGGFGSQITSESIPFEKIINVQVIQTSKQRVYGIGNIIFKLTGEEHIVTDIPHPYEIEQAIYKILQIERERGIIKPVSGFGA